MVVCWRKDRRGRQGTGEPEAAVPTAEEEEEQEEHRRREQATRHNDKVQSDSRSSAADVEGPRQPLANATRRPTRPSASGDGATTMSPQKNRSAKREARKQTNGKTKRKREKKTTINSHGRDDDVNKRRPPRAYVSAHVCADTARGRRRLSERKKEGNGMQQPQGCDTGSVVEKKAASSFR